MAALFQGTGKMCSCGFVGEYTDRKEGNEGDLFTGTVLIYFLELRVHFFWSKIVCGLRMHKNWQNFKNFCLQPKKKI
jgi:hypothetical protein